MFTFYRNWKNSGLGIRSLVFWANHSFFVKNEQMSNSLKKTSNSHILVSEPERIAKGRSFYLIKLLTVAHFWWATWAISSQLLFCHEHLSDLLTSLFKKEGMSESLIFFAQKWANKRFAQKNERFTHSLIFDERPEWFAHDRSFPLSDLSESLMVAHFWWATWVIRSHRSFFVSDLSDSLTLLTKRGNKRFAHLKKICK